MEKMENIKAFFVKGGGRRDAVKISCFPKCIGISDKDVWAPILYGVDILIGDDGSIYLVLDHCYLDNSFIVMNKDNFKSFCDCVAFAFDNPKFGGYVSCSVERGNFSDRNLLSFVRRDDDIVKVTNETFTKTMFLFSKKHFYKFKKIVEALLEFEESFTENN